jgi:hypothetical protein
MAPFTATKSEEQRRKDTIVMITAIMFVGMLMSGILAYKMSEVESLDASEIKAEQDSRKAGEPAKREPNPWAM